MLKRLLVPVLTAALLPVGTARAVAPGPVAAAISHQVKNKVPP